MTMRMLIDARHPEETRVAVVKGNRIEEFDFESAEHKQLKGNIYLAKVTRVEPSLQAAFVDYGGNRHGFLAFSEIHPDYYQIPREDREALLREEAEHAEEEARLRAAELEQEEGEEGDAPEAAPIEAVDVADEFDADDSGDEAPPATAEEAETGSVESAAETLRKKRQALRRRYKIQDVIKRRQVLLVQVVKEERGNKGAALTTYLSLAGRYCVLMPNTSHGGGISRKISNGSDRKRLKQIMAELSLPATMGLIVRTAGLERTRTEIKRDFDYLARLWDEIRDKTLHSTAPALIYQDSDLVKRAIRDLYNREIDEVIVEGEAGYKDARTFMKLLMPSHVRRVKQYVDPVPLFQRHGVEDQLSAMYQPVVQLKSGGYIVINPTEALVSIDINSGRSTREHNIEQTAFMTNIEAAHEVARQLRLRDMAGLVVIDFIDMEQAGHIRKVEKAMKEALKNDRARIQVGRISSFGLMEMSRQRLRTGVLEASTRPCPHCEGTGLIRTASSAGLSGLRMIEDEAARGRGSRIVLRAGREAAIYLLNRKRDEIIDVERRYGVAIEIVIDESFEGARMTVESSGPPPVERSLPAPVAAADEDEDVAAAEEDEEEEEAEAQEARPARQGEERGEARRRRRRRGRRGGRRRERGDAEAGDVEGADAQAGDAEAGDAEGGEESPAEAEAEAAATRQGEDGAEAPADAAGQAAEPARKGRRRPRARKRDEQAAAESMSGAADIAPAGEADATDTAAPAAPVAAEDTAAEAEAEAKPAPRKRARRKRADADADAGDADAGDAGVAAGRTEESPGAESPAQAAPAAANDAEPTPRRRRSGRARAEPAATPEPVEPAATVAGAEAPADSDDAGEPPRRGWWQRTFGA